MIEKKLITPEIYASFRSGDYIARDYYDGNSDLHIYSHSYYYMISTTSSFKICDYKIPIKEARKICKFLLKRDHIFSDIDYEKKEEHLNEDYLHDLFSIPIKELVKNKTGKDCALYFGEGRLLLMIRD